jgi:hypothetical protein
VLEQLTHMGYAQLLGKSAGRLVPEQG